MKLQQDDEVQSALKRATGDAEKTAVRDDKGKIKQITARVFSDTYQSYQLDYEKDNIAGVTNEKGERLRFLRDKQGGLRGIEFPNGGKALFQFHKSKNGTLSVDGITFVRPDGTIRFEFNSSQSTNFQQINFIKAGLSSKFANSSNRKLRDACSRAINTAGAVALVTAVNCAAGNYISCATGAVATAVAIANAVEICNED